MKVFTKAVLFSAAIVALTMTGCASDTEDTSVSVNTDTSSSIAQNESSVQTVPAKQVKNPAGF